MQYGQRIPSRNEKAAGGGLCRTPGRGGGEESNLEGLFGEGVYTKEYERDVFRV